MSLLKLCTAKAQDATVRCCSTGNCTWRQGKN